ncbi:MAG: hypothetical protein AB7E12_04760 [Burkholderiaceae bacterium]
MPHSLPPVVSKSARYRGSSLLSSSVHRAVRVAPAVVLLWAVSGWALGWWQ